MGHARRGRRRGRGRGASRHLGAAGCGPPGPIILARTDAWRAAAKGAHAQVTTDKGRPTGYPVDRHSPLTGSMDSNSSEGKKMSPPRVASLSTSQSVLACAFELCDRHTLHTGPARPWRAAPHCPKNEKRIATIGRNKVKDGTLAAARDGRRPPQHAPKRYIYMEANAPHLILRDLGADDCVLTACAEVGVGSRGMQTLLHKIIVGDQSGPRRRERCARPEVLSIIFVTLLLTRYPPTVAVTAIVPWLPHAPTRNTHSLSASLTRLSYSTAVQ